MNKRLTFVDLFAGCGGLSLGLELAGFEPLLVCELNHDAMDTYLANRRGYELAQFHDIKTLTNATLRALKSSWKTSGVSDIDLVAGGPPCQGYSGIGHRRSYGVEKEEIPSNYLYKEMARVVRALTPKMFLFENVRGLVFSRWTKDGEKGEIWRDVLATLQGIDNYTVRHAVVEAREYGVPQNRPRVLVVGVRKDLGWSPRAGQIADGLLPQPSGYAPDISELLSDLVDKAYLGKAKTDKYLVDPHNPTQVILRTCRNKKLLKKGDVLKEQEYSNHSEKIREKFQYMIEHDGEIPEEMKTKKFSQRVLPAKWESDGPTITATSMPDDYVHYCQPRILTVREWARLQMFPDWYLFCGSRTTGGQRRAGNPHKGVWDREVPKYTQIGNAVPVELARQVGIHLHDLVAS